MVRLKAVARYPRKLTLAEDLDFMHPNPLITTHGMVTEHALPISPERSGLLSYLENPLHDVRKRLT